MNSATSGTNRHRRRFTTYCDDIDGHKHPLLCDCGFGVKVQISWTSANPGRRFVSCPIRGKSKCGFFYWCDDEICDRGKRVISDLRITLQKNDAVIRAWQIFGALVSALLVIIALKAF